MRRRKSEDVAALGEGRTILTSEEDEQKTLEGYQIRVDELLFRQVFCRVHLLRRRHRGGAGPLSSLGNDSRYAGQLGRPGVVYYSHCSSISITMRPSCVPFETTLTEEYYADDIVYTAIYKYL